MTVSSRSASIVASALTIALGLVTSSAQTPAVPTLDDVLARAGAYVADYETKFSLVVSEEKYLQTQDRVPGMTARRQLKSDVAVLNAGAAGWMGFRDVFEV